MSRASFHYAVYHLLQLVDLPQLLLQQALALHRQILLPLDDCLQLADPRQIPLSGGHELADRFALLLDGRLHVPALHVEIVVLLGKRSLVLLGDSCYLHPQLLSFGDLFPLLPLELGVAGLEVFIVFFLAFQLLP